MKSLVWCIDAISIRRGGLYVCVRFDTRLERFAKMIKADFTKCPGRKGCFAASEVGPSILPKQVVIPARLHPVTYIASSLQIELSHLPTETVDISVDNTVRSSCRVRNMGFIWFVQRVGNNSNIH